VRAAAAAISVRRCSSFSLRTKIHRDGCRRSKEIFHLLLNAVKSTRIVGDGASWFYF
jgi:hypothetical protein